MRTARFPILWASGLATVLLVGCSGGGESTSGDDVPAVDVAGSAESAAALVPAAGEVVLAGTVGCGHCTYHLGDSCAAAMRAGGIVYFLDGIEAGHELYEDRMSEKPLTVVGTVAEKDGEKRVTVRDYRM